MVDAPSCPISFPQATPGAPVFHRGDPWSRPGHLQDLVNSIPRAHDLPSVIRALNVMNNIITQITRGEPAVNNVTPAKPVNPPDVKLKGEDRKPDPLGDWNAGMQNKTKQKCYNPDNPDQWIEISTVTAATWQSVGTLTYLTPEIGGNV
jgi:hypothetical protein